MNRAYRSRKTIDKVFKASTISAVLICMLLLVFLVLAISYKGVQAIDLAFLFSKSRDFGAEGGILYQLIGSSLLVTGAIVICAPLALGAGIFKSELLKSRVGQRVSDMLIYGLNGVPSIIFGIFGLIFFVNFLNTGISWFVGSIILAFMMLPTVVLTTYQLLHNVPEIYRDTALSLGYNKWQVIGKVLLPHGLRGLITGLFIGLARAVGETAPIMFIATAYMGVTMPNSLFEPVTALPTHIFALAQQATDPQALQNAWGSSFVLICLVLIFSSLALMSRVRLQTYERK